MMNKLSSKLTHALSALVLLVATVTMTTAHSAEVDDMVFFQNDHLGSAIVAVNEYGDLCWNETYTPFGDKTLDEDIGFGMPDGCGLLGQERGYTSHTEDVESGLTYMQQRFYDPTMGRFLSVDPISVNAYDYRTINRYSYAANNPYRYTDPTGEAFGDPEVTDDEFPDDLDWTNEDYDWNSHHDSDNEQSVSNALDRKGAEQDEWLAGDGGIHPAELVIGGGVGSFGVRRALSFVKSLFRGKSVANLSKSQQKSIRSLESRIKEHQQKLDDFKRYPDAFDNKGFLKNAPNEKIRQQIIAGRVRHLEKEIQNFQKGIDDILHSGGGS